MDSLQIGTQTARSKFVGYFREDDPSYQGGPGDELTDLNEIVVDAIPPGTRIEYFVTSNYVQTPELMYILSGVEQIAGT